MKHFLILVCACSVLSLSSCFKASDLPHGPGQPPKLAYRIAVVSDIHYLSPSLLKHNAASGRAFQDYLAQDPKLIEYSDLIFKQCIQQLLADKPDLLLIPGDLTKDGEKVCHQDLLKLLAQLDEAGIKTMLVPGNHDINNPESVSYDGDNASPEPSASAAEFATLYAKYGYTGALSRDDQSLSYVTEAFPGLWVMGLDANRYEDNKSIAIVGGRLKPATRTWALHWIQEAKKKHVRLIGMMHHGLVEHYTGQNQLDPGYVIDDYETIADEFSNAGLALMFTGHYHANDITQRETNKKILYDIETGSMVTSPSPYRMMRLSSDAIEISTLHVNQIDGSLPGGLTLPAYSNRFLSDHLDGYIGYAISHPPYSLPEELVNIGAPLLRNGFMAHYAGDEAVSGDEQARIDAFGAQVPPLGEAINGLWTDLTPSDNNITLPLP